MPSDDLRTLIARWRDDSGATYRTWFLWEERLKNFRSIRRGIGQVIDEIEAGTFGTQYKARPLAAPRSAARYRGRPLLQIGECVLMRRSAKNRSAFRVSALLRTAEDLNFHRSAAVGRRSDLEEVVGTRDAELLVGLRVRRSWSLGGSYPRARCSVEPMA